VQINSNNGGVEVIVREILVKDYSLKSVTESLMNRFWELSELPKETKVYAEWQIAYANQNENTGTPVFIVDPIEKRGSLRLMIIPLNVHGKMIEIVIKAHSSSDRNTVSEMVFNSMTFNK